jgi:hypothetical protein
MVNFIESYLKGIYGIANSCDATEESCYSTLESLLNKFAISKKKIYITTLSNIEYLVHTFYVHLRFYFLQELEIRLNHYTSFSNMEVIKRC